MDKSVDMKKRFLVQGYLSDCIDEAYEMGLQKSRDKLLRENPPQKKVHSILFSTPYTPNCHKLGSIIKKHWHVGSSNIQGTKRTTTNSLLKRT